MWLISCAIHIFPAELITLYIISARYPIKDKDLFFKPIAVRYSGSSLPNQYVWYYQKPTCLRQIIRAEEGIHVWLLASSKHATNVPAGLHTQEYTYGTWCVRTLISHRDSHLYVFTYLSTFFPYLTFWSSLAPLPHLLIQTWPHQNHAHPALARSQFLRQKHVSQDWVGFCSQAESQATDQPICMQTVQEDATS